MTDVIHLTGPVLTGPSPDLPPHPEAWIVGGRITYERPAATSDALTLFGVVVPGLVDAHCHVGLGPEGPSSMDESEQQARADLAAGALLLRDAGSPVDTRWVDEREDLPRIIRAGRHIARPRRYIRGIGHEVEPDRLVEQARIEAGAGDGWVKFVGDWIDRETGDLAPCWPADVLAEAVAAAHEEGARTTAHCFGPDSLRDFAAAGTDCVEHGTGLEPDTIEAFARRGVAVVPTLVNVATFPAIAEPAREKFPDYHRRMVGLHERRRETFAAAHDAGIPLYVGTDAGGSITHGRVVDEVEELVGVGLTHAEALDAATWAARAWLGRPALEEGEPADLLVLEADPRSDVTALRGVVARVLRGKVVAA